MKSNAQTLWRIPMPSGRTILALCIIVAVLVLLPRLDLASSQESTVQTETYFPLPQSDAPIQWTADLAGINAMEAYYKEVLQVTPIPQSSGVQKSYQGRNFSLHILFHNDATGCHIDMRLDMHWFDNEGERSDIFTVIKDEKRPCLPADFMFVLFGVLRQMVAVPVSLAVYTDYFAPVVNDMMIFSLQLLESIAQGKLP